MEDTMNIKLIYRQRLAGYLMTKGFPLMGMIPSEKSKGFNVFLFKASDKLQEEINKYTGEHKAE